MGHLQQGPHHNPTMGSVLTLVTAGEEADWVASEKAGPEARAAGWVGWGAWARAAALAANLGAAERVGSAC